MSRWHMVGAQYFLLKWTRLIPQDKKTKVQRETGGPRSHNWWWWTMTCPFPPLTQSSLRPLDCPTLVTACKDHLRKSQFLTSWFFPITLTLCWHWVGYGSLWYIWILTSLGTTYLYVKGYEVCYQEVRFGTETTLLPIFPQSWHLITRR